MSDYEIVTPQTNSYKEDLQYIEYVRRAICQHNDNLKIRLPQIVVIGDQSSGKSSVLSALMGIPFPVNTKMCTKCPIIIHSKSSHLKEKQYSINGEIFSQDEIGEKIESLNNQKNSTIGDTPICIEVNSKECDDLVLIDLPGLTVANEEQNNVIRKMITKYIQCEETIILTVTNAICDDETQSAITLAKQHDPNSNRTLRIYTQCDRLVGNAEQLQNVFSKLSCVSKLSPHIVVCRYNGAKTYCDDAEDTCLRSLQSQTEDAVDASRCGILSLRERLPQLLSERIRINLPKLQTLLETNLKRYKSDLKILGREPRSKRDIMEEVHKKLFSITNDIINEKKTSPILEKTQDTLHQSELCISKEWINDHYRHNSLRVPFFQGEDTFNACLEKVCDQWKPILDDFCTNNLALFENIFENEELFLANLPKKLRRKLIHSWKECHQTCQEALRKIAQERLDEERKFKTINHYIESRYKEVQILPLNIQKTIAQKICNAVHDGCVEFSSFLDREFEKEYINKDDIKTECKKNILKNTGKSFNTDEFRMYIQDLIRTNVEGYVKEYEKKTISQQNQQRVHSAIVAYYIVAKKNITDQLIVCVRKGLIDIIQRWLENFNYDLSIQESCVEDDNIIQQRIQCIKYENILNKCLVKMPYFDDERTDLDIISGVEDESRPDPVTEISLTSLSLS